MIGRIFHFYTAARRRYAVALRCCPASLAVLVVCGIAWMSMLGCQPKASQPATADAKPARPAVSNVPLRVWFVAPVAEPELLQRQWLAKSEQPLALRSLTVPELLEETDCQCDVLVYPASLIGELVQRGWIVKQPTSGALSAVRETDNAPTNESQPTESQPTGSQPTGSAPTESFEWDERNAPATWLAQSTYADQVMGLSLGCAVPVLVASPGLADTEGELTWEAVLSNLQVAENDSPKFAFDAADVDAEALVDRFFSIVASLSERDPGYGMLFDLQSMQTRVADSEYLQAAGILAGLAAQPDGLSSVIGSHSAAWTWSTTRETPALAIAAPILLDGQAAAITGGHLLKLKSPSEQSRAEEAARSASASSGSLAQRPQVAWWSTGGGLVASMSSRCRQSNQAQVCLKWMQSPTTRTVMSTLIPGIEAASPSFGNESLSWQAQRQLSQQLNVAALSIEPRLPLASKYRQELAAELQNFLSGKKNSSRALKDTAQRWNEITRQAGAAQRSNYEHSLNL